jgi:hypothetical protein
VKKITFDGSREITYGSARAGQRRKNSAVQDLA